MEFTAIAALTEHDVAPKWRHTRSVGQSVAGGAPAWLGPRRMHNNEASDRDIATEYMSRPDSNKLCLHRPLPSHSSLSRLTEIKTLSYCALR